MKKVIIPIVIVCILFVGFIVSIPLVNNNSAKNVEEQLLEVPLPDNTEIVESLSKAGKLTGNGNGMQYYGAILIKSQCSREELSDYYSEKLPNTLVKEQKTQRIEFIEHENLTFETPITNNDNYYIVYMYGSGKKPFSYLDIRGY